MKMRAYALFFILTCGAFAAAQTPVAIPVAAAPVDPNAQLTQRLDQLEKEVKELREAADEQAAQAPEPTPAPPPVSEWKAANPGWTYTGLGPVESKIYFSPENKWVAGLNAQFFSYTQQNGPDRSNVGSLAPEFAFRLHPRLLFNSQLLVENGGAESSNTVTLQKGQVIVQMAYLDWAFNDHHQAGLRVGHQLIPVGLTNTSNGPTTYFSVQAPELERELIPGSWHENGMLVYVERPRASFEAGAFSSLDSSGFRQSTFLAGGRSQGQNSSSEDLMGAFRLTVHGEHALVGGSIVFGNTAQDNEAIRSGGFQIMEAHARVHSRRFQLTAMTVQAQLQDAAAISILNSTTMPEQARGSSLEGAANLVGGERALWLFSRYSHYNLHDRVPEGYTVDPTLNKTVWTSGVNYYPLANVVIKADYAQTRTAAGGTGDKEFELGLALIY